MSDSRPIVSSPETSIMRDYWRTAPSSTPDTTEELETTTETTTEE